MEERLRNRIVVNPGIMAKGTRIPVDAIIHRIADAMSIDEIVEDYPNLKKIDVKAALEYSL